MDDTAAPKAKDGIVTIYRSPDHGETPFIRSLQKGDGLQLIWVEKAKHPHWSFIVPQSWSSGSNEKWQSVTQTSDGSHAPVTAAPRPTSEYQPATVEDAMVFSRVAQDMADNLVGIYSMVRGLLPDGTPEETVRAFSSTVFIQANKVYRPGMTVYEVVEHTELEQRYLDNVAAAVTGEPTKAAVATAIITALVEMYTSSKDNVIAVFKENEVSSDDLDPDDTETWLGFLYAIDNWHRDTQPAF